ncbi:MAG: rhomboid family intramembrane serine protease [Bacteroidota bacterium]|nr:rhomboid family intramembrane serine protease [Bacteroidota bacterium]
MDILNEVKKELTKRGILNQLIYINIIIFIMISILDVIGFLFQSDTIHIIEWLAMPADYNSFITKPWSIISYMFVHQSFLHLLFNLLWLYFGGKLFLAYMNQKQLLTVYIIGGVIGGLCFSIGYNIFPVFSTTATYAIAIGASASVLAIMVAIATYSPNYRIYLNFNRIKKTRWIIAITAFFLQAIFLALNGVGLFSIAGETLHPIICGLIGFYIGTLERSPKIKYIILILIILDFISITKGNTGGHLAHLGGACFGYVYIKQLKSSEKINYWLKRTKNLFINNNAQKLKRHTKTDQEFRNQQAKRSKEIDTILEKISKSGYDSLTKKEKNILFESSKK